MKSSMINAESPALFFNQDFDEESEEKNPEEEITESEEEDDEWGEEIE